MISSEDFKRMTYRLSRASPGPWALAAAGLTVLVTQGQAGPEVCRFPAWPGSWENASFIVDARADVPRLLEEVQRLQAEVQRLQALVIEHHSVKWMREQSQALWGDTCSICSPGVRDA